MSRTHRSARTRHANRAMITLAAVAMTGVVLTACAPPGSSVPESSGSAGPVSTTLTSDDVTLQILSNTEMGDALKTIGEAFTEQHPNVTFDIVAEANANVATNLSRILTRDTPPDIIFIPTIAQPAKDGLLTDLDPYFDAYGWDTWSQGLLDINRVGADGQRGSGPLYAVGIGNNVTGVFYNKEIAEQVGMTEPPKTFDDMEAAAKKAVEAGFLGFSVAAKDAGTPMLLQEVQNSIGNAPEISAWTAQEPGATFDQPGMVEAAVKLQEWKGNGIISKDAVSVDYPTMMGDFQAGKSLFVAVGDWEAQRLVAAMGDNVGFFLMPNKDADAGLYAMAFPSNHAIPAGSKNKDVAAYFLNWLGTDEVGRQLIVDTIGSSPAGPTDLPAPVTDVPLIQETSAAFEQVLREDGAVDSFTNVSQAFTLSTLNGLMQSMMLGSKTPQEFVDSVQSAYESELMN